MLLVLGILLNSCDKKRNTKPDTVETKTNLFDLNTTKTLIKEKTKQFTEAHIIKDTTYLNSIFTKDARVFPPNSEAVSGIKAISQLNTDWVNYGIYEFEEVSTAIYGNEDYIIDEGMYYLKYGEENTIDNGKYINIWKNVNGQWKIYSNIWNTNLPLELSDSE
ncbi:nuclear transport factor 2 family protein [Winogradskyella alexanderae]|uniref:Nuclear transport factor 2 family protein n=1 Tax=Winogradskyella alexanderae TaxID=2877123 RepID=A0ABS7XPA4_9FLAO|nr:nuclear transport factor 2 family protein [Winogradskyella alexanderae]MCA0131610.1 nuclear transport factor 2 family protein [Winogradskyella alexanderae]